MIESNEEKTERPYHVEFLSTSKYQIIDSQTDSVVATRITITQKVLNIKTHRQLLANLLKPVICFLLIIMIMLWVTILILVK